MRSAPMPPDEAERLSTLERYAILDTPPEAAFDGVARVAMALFGVPIAVVSLLDRERQWFKAHYGLDFRETARDIAFCPHVVQSRAPLYVADARADVRFDDNPLVTGGYELRAYCGVPLIAPDGTIPGTLDVLDTRPRPDFSRAQIERLEDLADAVVTQLEYRLARAHERELQPELELQQRLFDLACERTELAVALTDSAGRIVRVNRRLADWIGIDERDLPGRQMRHWLEAAATPGNRRDARLRNSGGERMPVVHGVERVEVGDARTYLLHTVTDHRHGGAARRLQQGRAEVLERVARRADPEDTLRLIAELPSRFDPSVSGYVLVHRDRGDPLVLAPQYEHDPAASDLPRALTALDARARGVAADRPLVIEALDAAGPDLATLAQLTGAQCAAATALRSDEGAATGSLGVLIGGHRPAILRALEGELSELGQLAVIALNRAT